MDERHNAERSSERLGATRRVLAYAALVGVIAGVGAIAFDYLSQLGNHLLTDAVAGHRPGGPAGEQERFHPTDTPFGAARLVAVTMGGGLLAGLLVFGFAPEAKGHGTDGAVDAYHHRQGTIRPQVPLVKMVASAITLGSSGSGGREGPIAQIGAGFGSWLGTRMGLSDRERRILLASGMAAGVGAIFKAPLAGALFGAEILYSDSEFESTVIIPAAVSSIVGYCVFAFSAGLEPVFATQQLSFSGAMELIGYTALALVLAAVARLYVVAFYGTERLFDRLPIPRFSKPMLGGLLTGLTGIGLYHLLGDVRAMSVLGTGYGVLQEVLDRVDPAQPEWALVLLLVVVGLGKIATTSFTISSGGSAGVFGPSMVIGGTMGAAVGITLHALVPQLGASSSAYALVGMAGFFAGVANTPISTIVMVSEITGSYDLLVPSLWVCALTFILCRGQSLYQSQVPNKIHSPAHQGDFRSAQLAGLRVSDLVSPDRPVRVFTEADPLDVVLAAVAETRQELFPVVSADGRLAGGFSIESIRRVLEAGDDLQGLVVAVDLVDSEIPTISVEAPAREALELLADTELNEVAVLAGTPPRVIATLRQRDVLLAIHPRTAS